MSSRLYGDDLYLTPEQRESLSRSERRAQAEANHRAANAARRRVEKARAALDRAEAEFEDAVRNAMTTPYLQRRAVERASGLSRARLYQIKDGTNGHKPSSALDSKGSG